MHSPECCLFQRTVVLYRLAPVSSPLKNCIYGEFQAFVAEMPFDRFIARSQNELFNGLLASCG